jgi:hypothetical protein
MGFDPWIFLFLCSSSMVGSESREDFISGLCTVKKVSGFPAPAGKLTEGKPLTFLYSV